jgi:hypothetical protein
MAARWAGIVVVGYAAAPLTVNPLENYSDMGR